MLPQIDRLFRGYIFDLDGTIWLTDQLVPGARETIAKLRSYDRRIVFLTNNSDGTREMFAEKLNVMGVGAGADEVVCTSYVMARYLQGQSPGSRCYVLGADPLREELCKAGLVLRDRPGEIDYVVLGIDRDISYKKLQTAFSAIRNGALLVATNPDPYVPTAQGDLLDIGALIAALEVASEHKVDMMVGKPNPYIVNEALNTIGLSREECLMVGDQLGTDVVAGNQAKVKTALLLRDPRVVEQIDGFKIYPDYILEKLIDLIIEK